MTTTDISRKASNLIKRSGIKPAPRLRHAAVNLLFWSLAGVSLIVGALALSVSANLVIDNDWFGPPGRNPLFVLRAMPLLWLAALTFFVYLGERYYRHTSLGYRHRLILVLAAYIGATVILGSAMYSLGWGRSIDASLAVRVPRYRHLVWNKEEVWSHPAEGLLAGRIRTVTDGDLTLVDLYGREWRVDLSRAVVRNRVIMERGEMIKMLGRQSGNETFAAQDVRPWERGGRGRNGDRRPGLR